MDQPPGLNASRAFFGVPQRRRRVAGFDLALLDALPDREIGRHDHGEGHAVLALSGRYVSDAAPGAEGPMLIYNPPGTGHHDRFAADRGRISGQFIGLTISVGIQDILDGHLALPPKSMRVMGPGAAAAVMRAWRLAGMGDEAACLDAEFACLNFLADTAGWVPRETRRPRWLTLAQAMLETPRAVPLSVAALAQAAGVHPVHFARAYRAATGETPGLTLRRLQVHYAAQTVRGTRRPLAEIALAHGFADQPHMTRAFRAIMGVTPATLRHG